MENLVVRYVDTIGRVIEFGLNNPLTPALASVTALNAQLTAVNTAIRTHQGEQESGRGEFLGGSSTRAQKAEQLLTLMRPINQIARTLRRDQFPGVREKFFMPRFGGYEGIIGRAVAFVEAVGPIKAAFVSRGLAETFDTELTAAKDALLAAVGDKGAGLSEQVGGTAGLMDKAREGLFIVRELDAILSYQYRNNSTLLASWKSACHVERPPKAKKKVGGTGQVQGGGAVGVGGAPAAS